jgi:hypothetical protein
MDRDFEAPAPKQVCTTCGTACGACYAEQVAATTSGGPFEETRAGYSRMLDEEWERRPAALRSTPSKAHAWLSAFSMRDDAADRLVELLDATTKSTVELCAAAIRQRANYLSTHYTAGVAEQVRHVAYWLESNAGIECMAAIDEALPSVGNAPEGQAK